MLNTATFEEALEAIFVKTDFPQTMRTFLLSQVPPITSLDVFASCVTTETLQATLLDPAGFGTLPEDQKLSVRGRVAAAWALARKRFDEVHTSEKPKDPQTESTIPSEKRLAIISSFQARYSLTLPPDMMPSERTLALAHNARRKRSAEPIPFSMVLSVKDGGGASTGYTPIAPGSSVLVMATGNSKKNHQWMHSIPHYMHTLEILLFAYVMASTQDEPGREWLHLDVALLYLAKLRKLERINSLSDPNIWSLIADCEAQTRIEWHDKNLSDPSLCLGDLITLSLEHDRFPDTSKFTPAKQTRKKVPVPPQRLAPIMAMLRRQAHRVRPTRNTHRNPVNTSAKNVNKITTVAVLTARREVLRETRIWRKTSVVEISEDNAHTV